MRLMTCATRQVLAALSVAALTLTAGAAAAQGQTDPPEDPVPTLTTREALDLQEAAGDDTEFDPFTHGAVTVKGETWSDPRTGPDTQTRTGISWPLSEVNEDPAYYGWGCHVTDRADDAPIGCVINPDGATEVVVVGSSYVGQWMPAILEIADREDWAVTIHTKTWCDFQPGREITIPSAYPECDSFNTNVLELLHQDVPDLILTSHYDRTAGPHMVGVYRDLMQRGVDDVVGIWNSYRAYAQEGPGLDKAAWCVRDIQNNDYTGDYTTCHYGKGHEDEQGNAAMRLVDTTVGRFHYVPLQDWMCPPDSTVAPRCPGVIGRVVPWRNGAHLTNEWTHSMTNVLHEALYQAGVTTTRPDEEAGTASR